MSHKLAMMNVPDSVRYWLSDDDAFLAIKRAAHDTLQSDVRHDNPWRKLSHVRFLGTVLKQFVERRFDVDEESRDDSKLACLTEVRPELAYRAEQLRVDQRTLRGELPRLLHMIEHACASDSFGCEELFNTLMQFLAQIEILIHRETDLIQDAFESDLGGES